MNSASTSPSLQTAVAPVSPVVYVVDDDEAVRDSMRWMLEANGFRVRSFDSAEAFLSAGPPQDAVSCLLLDVRMPGLSGLGDRKSTRLNSSHVSESRMPSSA